jgi:shikimate kinase
MNSSTVTHPPEEVRGNVILVGLMGAGKTSVGKVLAKLLGKDFLDSDHEIERATGVRIPVIFEIEGETGFRAREHKMLASLTERQNILLATGGGAVLLPDNRTLLRNSGTVIYLRAPVKSLLRRTQRDRSRPLLRVPDPAAKLNELYALRDPLYRDAAHLVVDTGNQSVRSLAAQIEALLKNRAHPQPTASI